MRGLLLAPLIFLQLLYQSVHLAIGQIWANKTRSILTTIGIIIGVASVTGVIAALTGLKAKILSQVETLGSSSIFVQPERPLTGPKSNLNWWEIRLRDYEFANMLEHCPSVEKFSKFGWIGKFTVKYSSESVYGVELIGVEPCWQDIDKRTLVSGRKFSDLDDGRAVCLIGEELRDKLGLSKECEGQIIRLGFRNCCIIGVLEKRADLGFRGGNQDYHEVMIPFGTAKKINPWMWISVLAASKTTDLTEDAVMEIKFFLRKTRHIRPGEPDTFRVESLKSAIKTFNEIALVVTLVASGVVGISLLVGGVGIMNIMLVSISERTREIGLRKAVGAKKSAILTQFLVEAVILCFTGGLVGVGIGELLTFGIAKINPVLEKTYIPAWAIALSFGFAGIVGIFFGMFPAIKAARLDPIEALRHE